MRWVHYVVIYVVILVSSLDAGHMPSMLLLGLITFDTGQLIPRKQYPDMTVFCTEILWLEEDMSYKPAGGNNRAPAGDCTEMDCSY